ncbi:unnamed protein product, partial [Staurois parvus]
LAAVARRLPSVNNAPQTPIIQFEWCYRSAKASQPHRKCRPGVCGAAP